MSGVNGQAVLQIAETRFAIKCDYAPFMEWLREACGDFLVEGEPHAKINLSFDVINNGHSSSKANLRHRFDDDGTSFKITWPSLEDPDDMFRSMLRLFLQLSPIIKQPTNLWIHSSGVIHKGEAYIFTGPSGAGKTTICDILSPKSGFTVIHDDAIVISQNTEGFRAWSSPVHGSRPAFHSVSAPIRALFFIHQAKANHISRLTARNTVGLLTPDIMLVPMTKTSDGLLIDNTKKSLEMILRLVENVPCYELHFKPDYSFWECIEESLEENHIGKGLNP
jgi:hypothetical protein